MEAQNQAMLNAMQFAGQEQQRQAQLGTGMLALLVTCTTGTVAQCVATRNDRSRTSETSYVGTSRSLRSNLRYRS